MMIIKILLAIISVSWCSMSIAGTCKNIVDQISTVSFGTMVVQRDTPVGTVISSKSSSGTSAYLTECVFPVTLRFSMYYQGGKLSNLGEHIYDTNIPGVGVRFSTGYYFDNPPTITSYSDSGSVVGWWGGNVELIVTGKVTSGSLSAETLGKIGVQGSDEVYRDGLTVNLTGGEIVAPACSLTTQALNFPIGNVKASDFGGSIGSVPSSSTVTENLGLSCDVDANINIELNGAKNNDTDLTSVLAITDQGNAGIADGVGVQLLYNGTPLELNKNIVLKKSTGGQETFPIVARYYQTKTTVMPGKANTSATLNLTYQ